MFRIQEGHVQGGVVPAYFPLSSECRITMRSVGELSANMKRTVINDYVDVAGCRRFCADMQCRALQQKDAKTR